ncbi:MAG: NAD-dependent epimerase/dehydratase family protein [Phycisphaerales bacterium JB059]
MTQSVLITGAAGFIGSSVAARLARAGVRVTGLDNYCDFYDPAIKRARAERLAREHGVEIVEGDIRSRADVDRSFDAATPDGVIHIAAMAGVRPSIENPKLYTEVNLDGTVNMLDASVTAGVSKFLFASSSSVYGNNDKVPFSEEDPVDHPISPYAATKRAGELICHTYTHLHALPVTCLRFFTVYGPGQRPDLAIGKFMRLIDEGKPVPMFGDGTTSRDYTYIDDIVDGVLAALERCAGFNIYNLGGSSPVTLRELIEAIGRAVGKTPRIEQLPMQPGDVERTFADTSRSRRELEFESRVSLEEGLARQWASVSAER